MLGCLADEDGERQEGRNDESYVDNGNIPELRCGAGKHTEDQTDEMCGGSRSSEGPSWQPEESDSFPSIFLAAFLAFIFVSVSVVLLGHQTARFPLRDLKALSPNRVPLPKEDFQSFHLFFPSQPDSTWGTFLRYVCYPLEKSPLEEPWILVGIGPGDTSRTLLCFTKMMLSFLTQQKSIGVEFLDSTSPWLPPMGSSENRTWAISSVEVLWGQKSPPGGLVVSLQGFLDGKGKITKDAFALVGNEIQERFLLRRLTTSLISRILSLDPDKRPTKVMTDHENFLVLFITSEQYLESGLAC